MNSHLSQDQLARSIVGQAATAEQQHLAGCEACSAELERFDKTMVMFRSALRDRVDERVASPMPAAARSAIARGSAWRWALAAASVAVFVLGMFPFFLSEPEPRQVPSHATVETDPEVLMEAVNRHLSRTMPAPMERVISLMPVSESTSDMGGVQ